MSDKPIDAEVVPESQALVVRPAQTQAVSLFGTSEPVQVIEKASQVASALKDVIKKQGLISNISGKEYPKCEAWTLLGTMIGVFPVLVWTKHLENGWEARVEARTRDGSIVGAAEAQCLATEKNWRNRDDFALRSMAQTRATAKALRMPLGFVMTLAGYEATPAEEMVTDHPQKPAGGSGRSTASSEGVKTPPTPKPAPRQAVCATPKTREWMIKELNATEGGSEGDRRICTEFFDKAGVITQTQAIEDVPLSWVPVNKVELLRLKSAIMDFASGGQAHIPYEQHAVEPSPKADSPSSGTSSAPTTGQKPTTPTTPTTTTPTGGDPNSEWFFDVMVPVPRKGMKRDEYLKHPDTIESLFEARHDDTAEAQEARQRLWGFVNHYEPKGWTKQDGTVMPPSEGDKKFREALDAFAEWFEKHHPGEKL